MHPPLPANSQDPQSFEVPPDETASKTLGPSGEEYPNVQTKQSSEDEDPGLHIPQSPDNSHQRTTVTGKPQAGSRRKMESTTGQGKRQFYSFKKMY